MILWSQFEAITGFDSWWADTNVTSGQKTMVAWEVY